MERKTETTAADIKIPEVRAHFSSRLAIILTCLGTVVGTGNIWRFPRIVARSSDEEGGLAFLVVWVVFLALWSVPMLLVEYGTGRYTQRGVITSFRHFLGDNFLWCGAWVCVVTFMIASYYSVVLGWCFYYFVYYCANPLPETAEESRQIFRDFAEDSYWPVLTHAIALILAGLAVSKGVKTIEKVSMVLVPLFLLIILFTFVWALTRDHADYGLKFLFSPKWESLGEPRTWVDALSQNAFDTGAGMGLMIPYSSFMTRTHAVVKYGTVLPAANNLVSLIAAMTVFSTVFSSLITSQPAMTREQVVDILKDSGPASTGITFIWVPVLFETVGTLGHVVCVLFFLCLSFAGLTSLISNMELTACTLDDFGLGRRWSMPVTVLLTYLMGLMSALNIDVLTNQDFVWGFALVISGLMLQGMVISYGVSSFRSMVVNDFGLDDWKLPKVWEYLVKFILPSEAVLIIVWWAIDLISDHSDTGEAKWYQLGRETFMVTIVQWTGLLLLLLTVNLGVSCYRRRARAKRNDEDSATMESSSLLPSRDIPITSSRGRSSTSSHQTSVKRLEIGV
ncbi:putative sodium-dependent transporter YocR [Babylonia areolata]|uniref:putative sodium-dependent transporter YocR n=1 Tax=Babylonia areolata TaxID=304850 RepID=UPI003FD29812